MTSSSTTLKRIALVTGANAGIGYETCKGLLKAGFHVIVCARSNEKAEAAVASLIQEENNGVPENSTAEPLVLDLGSFQSLRDAASTFLATKRPLHVCILNAGIMALPWKKTNDGLEQQWQVNFLGHFLFCRLLLSAMDPNHGRIVHVASGAHRLHPEEMDYELLAQEHQSAGEDFDQWRAYGRSKLANILFSNELARRLKESGSKITSNALHPGNVQTALWSKIGRKNESGISVEEGALTSIYLATSKKVQEQSGGYYVLCEPVTKIYNEEEAKGLDYISKSKLRSEVSMSETEGKALWAEASKYSGLSVDLL